MKGSSHHVHMPSMHDSAIWFSHVIHTRRFWAMLMLTAFLAMLLLFVIIAAVYGQSSAEEMPINPFIFTF